MHKFCIFSKGGDYYKDNSCSLMGGKNSCAVVQQLVSIMSFFHKQVWQFDGRKSFLTLSHEGIYFNDKLNGCCWFIVNFGCTL